MRQVEVRCSPMPICVVASTATVIPYPPPAADAGIDREVCLHEDFTLGGSASSVAPCIPVEYRWVQVALVLTPWGPNPRVTLNASGPATYTFEARCADEPTCLAPDQVDITTKDCSLAVTFDAARAVRSTEGVRVIWRTSMEAGSSGFQVWAKDAAGASWTTGWAWARGARWPYSFLDSSPRALYGTAVAYEIVEVTFDGTRDHSGWFSVEPEAATERGARRRGSCAAAPAGRHAQ